MSGSDDVPDYLKGVDNDFKGKDDFTIRPDREAPLGQAPVKKREIDDFDDDDDTDEARRRMRLRVPLQLMLLVFVAVGGLSLLVAAGVAAYGTWIADAEKVALSASGSLSRAIDEERKIIDELGSRGGDRAALLAQYAAIDEADGHQRGREAHAFTQAVDKQIIAIGDVRGTPIEDRQQKLSAAKGAYDEAMHSWESAAYNPIGQVAIAVGIANAPPAQAP